ncbi:30S ribosomal protein S5 [Candidatus Kaiserbacteria bacterium]|nr:30S ribosomal protein S5 [Candidatus Kaiserbacteria bacterium]USN92406.1 MAG: 30S ribosomal protein S5 [Candidatus Nomurabacteria bacterium]
MSEEKQQEATTGKKPRTAVETRADATRNMESATDAPAATSEDRGPRRRRRGDNDKRGGAGGRRPRRGGRQERPRQEFDQKIVSIRRVTRVMAGGRRFSFSVAIVIGDKKGKVGVGIGKAGDTQLAIEKAVRDAKKHMIVVPMDKEGRIPHDVHVKYASSEVMMMPASGRGLVAGSSVRTVLELAGVKDITAKIFSRSKNKLNNARATVEALKQLNKD